MKPRLKRITRSSVRRRLAPLRGPRALRVRKAPLRGARGSLRGPKPRPKSVLGQKKKRKLKVPKTPQKRRRPPSSCLKFLQEAVLTVREAKEGASLSKILRLLQVKYRSPLDKKRNNLIATELNRLAERGKVIRKEGHIYKFNLGSTNDSNSANAPWSLSVTSTTRSGDSQSGATSGSAPNVSGATSVKSLDSHTSQTSYCQGGNSGAESFTNGHVEDRSSTGDLSSSDYSASPASSRASSK